MVYERSIDDTSFESYKLQTVMQMAYVVIKMYVIGKIFYL